jgi:hypothetical protein
MILDRLEKGVATGDELVRESVVDDIEVYLDELVEKKLAINNGGSTYSLNSGGVALVSSSQISR